MKTMSLTRAFQLLVEGTITPDEFRSAQNYWPEGMSVEACRIMNERMAGLNDFELIELGKEFLKIVRH